MQPVNSNPFLPPRGAMSRWKSTVAAAALGVAVGASLLPAFSQSGSSAPAPSQPALSAPASLAPNSFADIVERVQPAVVSVKVKIGQADFGGEGGMGGLPEGMPEGLERFFRRFGEQMPPGMQQRGQVRMGQGSGFFISADGDIVTNNHVVRGATEVEIVTNDGRTLSARVVGTDARTDIALLKVKDRGTFPYVKLATTPPRVGDWVLAVGNPFGLGGSVTAGIVSARGRDIGSGPYDDYLQIDAAVNRGNSGGPTFAANGEVVGVNTAIYSPSGGNVGIAFAIPATTVAKVVEALKAGKQVERGFIGVSMQPVSPDIAAALGLTDARGAMVADVAGDSPASKAGLRRGDIIVGVDGDKIGDPRELARKIGGMKPGDKATLKVLRRGSETTVTVDLGRQPADNRAERPDGGLERRGG